MIKMLAIAKETNFLTKQWVSKDDEFLLGWDDGLGMAVFVLCNLNGIKSHHK